MQYDLFIAIDGRDREAVDIGWLKDVESAILHWSALYVVDGLIELWHVFYDHICCMLGWAFAAAFA